MARVRITIQGDPGAVSLRAFLTAMEESLNILEDLDSAVSGDGHRSLAWRVVGLSTGSATVEVESHSHAETKNAGPEVARYFVQGLDQIERQGTTPPYLSHVGMKHAAKLVRLIGHSGVAGLIAASDQLEPVTITAQAAAHIQPLLASRRKALGSVEGRIETVLIHGAQRCVVYLSRTKKAVNCRIPESDALRNALDATGRRVLASGTVHYNERREPMRIDVEHLRVLRREDELPSIPELTGSQPDFTGDQSTTDYLKELRGA